MSVQDILIRDEGMKLRVYLDSKGKMTIGVGRNLEDVGISEDEAMLLLKNDVAAANKEASKYSWFSGLDPVRQDVIVCMMFNLGSSKFSEFKRLFTALENHDFNSAASEMLDSRWAGEVGKRAANLAQVMKSGVMAP